MNIDQAALHRQADTIAHAVRAAFPNVLLPAQVPLGCGYWIHDEQGQPEYHYTGDGLYIEAFFRGVAFARLVGPTPQRTREALRRFFMEPPPARRWLDVAGEPLLSWLGVISSWMFLSVPARVYSVPAYLLTALPLLVTLRCAELPSVKGRADPLEFVVDTVEALIPPDGLRGQEVLRHLPPERRDPYAIDFAHHSMEEEFLQFVGSLTRLQRQVIGQCVALILVTYPFYIIDPSCSDQADMDALRQCWLSQ